MSDYLKSFEEDAKRNLKKSGKALAKYVAKNAANVTSIQVDYDGYGDEGNITEVRCYNGNDEIDHDNTLLGLIDEYVLDALLLKVPGWENNEGARGTIDVEFPSLKTTVDHYDRFTDEEYSQHEL